MQSAPGFCLPSLHSAPGGCFLDARWSELFLHKHLWTSLASSPCPLPSSLCPSCPGRGTVFSSPSSLGFLLSSLPEWFVLVQVMLT